MPLDRNYYRATLLLVGLSCFSPLFLMRSDSNMVMAQTPDARKAEADQLLKQGNEKLNTNQAQAAIPLLQQALVIYQQLQNRAGEGQVLKSLGNVYQALKEYEKALAHQQQALKIAQKINDQDLEARATNNIGLAYKELGKFDSAIEFYQRSLSVSRRSKNYAMEFTTLKNLGWLYNERQEYDRSIVFFKECLALARKIRNRTYEKDGLLSIGRSYQGKRNFDKAIEYYNLGLLIAKELKNRSSERDALMVLGLVYHAKVDLFKAIAYNQKALEISRDLNSKPNEIVLTGLLGIEYDLVGDKTRGISYLQESFLLAKEANNFQQQIYALISIGSLYERFGEYGKATDRFTQALLTARKSNNLELVGESLKDLSEFYLRIGEYSKAVEYADEYLEAARGSKDREEEINALYQLGFVYSTLDDLDKSTSFYRQGLKVAEEIKNDYLQTTALLHLASLCIARTRHRILAISPEEKDFVFKKMRVSPSNIQTSKPGELERYFAKFNQIYVGAELSQAIAYLESGLAIIRQANDPRLKVELQEGEILIALSQVYGRLGNPKAINYLNQALELSQKDSDVKLQRSAILGSKGLTYRLLGDYTKAIDFHRQSLVAARELKDPAQEGYALNSLGSALVLTKNFSEAEQALYGAMKIWETIRVSLGNRDDLKVSIFEQQQQTYRSLEEVLIARNKPETALEISERGRARVFAEQLAKQLSPNPKSQNSTVLQAAIQPPNIQQIKQIAQQQNATLVQYSIGIEPYPMASTRTLNSLFIWVVKPTGEVLLRQVNLTAEVVSLDALIAKSRDALGVRAFPQRATLIVKLPEGSQKQATEYQKQRSQQLHQLLIDPIADLLPKDPNDRVIFIPQGSLFLVPFPALQDANGEYLIEKHTILTAPSIQVLDQTHQLQQQRHHNPATETLVVGNPLMPIVTPYPGEPPQQLNALPGAEAEAQAIAPLLKTQALTGTQGTKAAIKQKMPNARIIHLATHGLLDDLRGLGSAIALAPDHPGTPNDGLLTAEEILDLKLSADLIVLSACDTGRGRITGDGVIGLSRSFISAGVPSIIVSLWAVPDAPTAELMTEFYTNWQVKKLDKAQALRQAMLSTMKAHPNPRDWAAFTLIGEAE